VSRSLESSKSDDGNERPAEPPTNRGFAYLRDGSSGVLDGRPWSSPFTKAGSDESEDRLKSVNYSERDSIPPYLLSVDIPIFDSG
jgi:hypothetical protein